LDLGEVINEPGDLIKYVYFPTNCIVSLLYEMLNGDSGEILVVGCECYAVVKQETDRLSSMPHRGPGNGRHPESWRLLGQTNEGLGV